MAFDPNFTDYRRADGGVYFKRPDDSEFFHTGDDADALAEYIEASKPADTRTAGLIDSAGRWGAAPSTSPEQARALVDAANPSIPPDAMAKLTAPGPGDVPPPAVPPPALPTSLGPAPGAAPGPSPDPASDALPPLPAFNPMVHVAGTNPAAADARAVSVRQGQTKTTEGAQEYSPELEQGYRELHDAKQKLALDQYLGADIIAREQKARAEAALPELMEKQAEAKRKVALIQDKVNEQRGNLDDLSAEAANAQLNGGSIFSNGAAAGIGTMISAALASFGSAILGGSGTAGFDIIDKAIERDVRRQRAEIERKGAKANNALALYQRRFGDLELAEDALKIVQHQKAIQIGQRAAALEGSVSAKQAFDKMQIESQQAELERKRAFEEKAHGKAVVTETSKFVTPVAAHDRARTLDEVGKYYEVAGKRAKAGQEIAKADAAARGEDPEMNAATKLAYDKDERERSVRLDTGERVFSPDEKRRIRFDELNRAAPVMRKAAADLEAILSTSGSSWSKEQQGKAKAVAETMTNMGQKLFDKGALSEGDRKDFESLTAPGGMDTFDSRTRILAALRRGMETVEQLHANESRELYRDPKLKTPYVLTDQEKAFKAGDTGETFEGATK